MDQIIQFLMANAKRKQFFIGKEEKTARFSISGNVGFAVLMAAGNAESEANGVTGECGINIEIR